jgi:peptidoglycan/LPS O-acetylase OafA/YrhL
VARSAAISTSRDRDLFLDALRGIAAMMVAVFHLYFVTPVLGSLQPHLPWVVDSALRRGYLGIFIFFVISGYVISGSLEGRLSSGRDFLRFIVRRQVRLDPPYWVSIALAVLSIAVINAASSATLRELPDWSGVIAHLFYVQDLLGYPEILPIYWTLCLEIQFYLVYGLVLLWATRAAVRAPLLLYALLPTHLLSLLATAHLVPMPRSVFLYFWYAFLIGVVLRGFVHRRVGRALLLSYLVPVALLPLYARPELRAIVSYEACAVVALAVLMAWMGRQRIRTAGAAAPLQFLGKISYSLYLTHALVGIRVVKLLLHEGASPLRATAMFAVGLALSVVSAVALHYAVEAPSMRLSARLFPRPSARAPSPAVMATARRASS